MSNCIFTNSKEYKKLQKSTGFPTRVLNAYIVEYQNARMHDPDAFPTAQDVYNLAHKRFYTEEPKAISVYNSIDKLGKGVWMTQAKYDRVISDLRKYFTGNMREVTENGKHWVKVNKPILDDSHPYGQRLQQVNKALKILEDKLEDWQDNISDMSFEYAEDFLRREFINNIGYDAIPKSSYYLYRDKEGYTRVKVKSLFESLREEQRVLQDNWGYHKDLEMHGMFRDRKISPEVLENHLHNLTEKFGVQTVFLKEAEYKKLFKDGSSAQYKDGIAYFNSDGILTKNIGVEEILHPYVYNLYWKQPEVFENLYFQARKNYPMLVSEIESKYEHNKEEEVVAQILAKFLNKEIQETEKNKSLLQGIWDALLEILDCFAFRRTVKNRYNGIEKEGNNYRITADYSYDGVKSYEDLAKLLNSKDIKVDVYTDTLQRAHLETIKENDDEVAANIKNQEESTFGEKAKLVDFDSESATLNLTENVTSETSTRDFVDALDKQLKSSVNPFPYGYPIYVNNDSISDTKIKFFKAVEQLQLKNNLLNVGMTSAVHLSKDDFNKLSKKSQKWLLKQQHQGTTEGDLIVHLPSELYAYDTLQHIAYNESLLALSGSKHITTDEVNTFATDFAKYTLRRLDEIRDADIKYRGKDDVFVLNDYGIDNIMQELHNLLSVNTNQALKEVSKENQNKAAVLNSNWRVFRKIIADQLINYGIKIDMDSVQVTDAEKAINKINEELEEDTDTVQELEGDLREHWQKNAKLVTIHESMLRGVKREIGSLLEKDNNGNTERNIFGIEKAVNEDETIVQIVNICDGCTNLSEMIEALRDASLKLPKLQPLVNKLSKTENLKLREAVFQSQFFASFYEHSNYYVRQYIGKDGTIKTVGLEQGSDVDEVVNKALKNLEENRKNLPTRIDPNNIIGSVVATFQVLGIADYIDTNAITDATFAQSQFNKRLTILKSTREDNTAYSEAIKKLLTGVYKNLFVPKNTSVAHSGTKTYSGFSDYSELTKFTEAVSSQNYVDWANENYDNAYFKDENGNWRTQWLKDYEANTFRGRKIISNVLNSKGIEYKDKTAYQYLASAMNYYSVQEDQNNLAWYPVPLQGDKTSEDYMLGYKRSTSEIYKKLSEQTLMQEINRLRAIRERYNRLKGVKYGPKPKYKNGKLIEHPTENEDSLIKNFDKKSNELVNKFVFLDILNDDFLDHLQSVNTIIEFDANDNLIYDKKDTKIDYILEAGLFSENKNFDISPNHNTGTEENTEGPSVETKSRRLLFKKQNTLDRIKQFKELRDKLIQTDYTEANELTQDKARLIALARPLIQIGMQLQALDLFQSMEKEGMVTHSKGQVTGLRDINAKLFNGYTIKDYEDKAQFIRDFALEYQANYKFASINMLQMTVTDPSFFKNYIDMQKRLGYQLHGAGRHVNTQAIDPVITQGDKRVSDGNYRTVIIQDFISPANSYFAVEQILNSLQKDVKTLGKEAQQGFERLKKAYSEVNWADGQSFICPTAYRKLGLMGAFEWTGRDEDMYNRRNGLNMAEILHGWQPLKPLVSAKETRNMHNSILPNLNTPIQFKNSAYVIMSIGMLSQAAGQQNVLTSLMNYMESTHSGKNRQQGIDIIQFDSAVKVGLSGVIDINNLSGEDVIQKLNERTILDKEGEKNVYNPTYVHTVGFDSFMIQQDNPEHLNDHEQQIGSQITILAMSDLADNVAINAGIKTTDEDGNEVEIKNGKQLKDEYWKTLTSIVQDNVNDVIRKYNLDTQNKYLRNVAISKLMQRQASTFEELIANTLDEDGNFNIPLSDPTQSKNISKLYSVIKESVFKKMIPGGPVVQVANYGTSKNLQIIFKDAQGNELKSAESLYYELAANPNNNWQWTYQDIMEKGISFYSSKNKQKYSEKTPEVIAFDALKEAYQNEIKNASELSHFECYVTPYSDALFDERFFDPQTNTFNIEAMREHNPKLLEMIGYRIPTESKYSIMPLKIAGFLPKSSGEGIMLPQEITLLSGSDFDMDKMYCMRNHFDEYLGTANLGKRESKVNYLLDLMRASLTSQASFSEMFTPGGFEDLKQLSQEFGEKTEGVNYEMNLTNPLTQVRLFSKNMVAAKLIGVFANNVSSSAFVRLCRTIEGEYEQAPTIYVNKRASFAVSYDNGAKIKAYQYVEIDPITDIFGQKTFLKLSQGLAASVDATKEDAISALNITMETVNVFTGLMRMGYPMRTAVLFLANPAVRNLVAEYQKKKFIRGREVSFPSFMSKYIARKKKEFKDDLNIQAIPEDVRNIARDNASTKVEKDQVFTVPISWLEKYAKSETMPEKGTVSENEYLTKGIQIESDELKMLQLFEAAHHATKIFRSIQSRTGYNSIAHAFGPYVADTIRKQSLDDEFESAAFDPIRDADNKTWHNATVTIETTLADYLRNHPYLNAVKNSCYDLEHRLVENNFIQASQSFRELYNMMKNRFGYLSEDTVRKLELFFISYSLLRDRTTSTGKTITQSTIDLSDTPTHTLFAKNADGLWLQDKTKVGSREVITSHRTEEKVPYKEYINSDSFIADIDVLKDNNPGNKFLQAITIKWPSSGMPYLSLSLKGKTAQQRQELANDWAALYEKFKDDKSVESNPALDLVAYNVFRGSYGFNPKTFLSVLPNSIKHAVPGYIQALNVTPEYTLEEINQMMFQFMLNNDIVDKIYDGEMSEIGTSTSSSRSPYTQIWYSSRENSYFLVNFEGGLGTFKTYKNHKQVPKLGGDNVGFEVYPNLGIQDIKKSVFEGKPVSEEFIAASSDNYTATINDFVEKTLNPEDYEDGEQRLNMEAVKIVFANTNNITIQNKIAGLMVSKYDPTVEIDDSADDGNKDRKWAYRRLLNRGFRLGEDKVEAGAERTSIKPEDISAKEVFEKLEQFCQI